MLRPPREVVPADPEMVFPEHLAVAGSGPRGSGMSCQWLADPAAHRRRGSQAAGGLPARSPIRVGGTGRRCGAGDRLLPPAG